MTASGQLRLPSCWAALPAKSSGSSSPSTVAVSRSSRSPSRASSTSVGLVPPSSSASIAGARAALGVVEHLVDRLARSARAAAVGELGQPPRAGAVGGELGAQVGAALGGLAHLGGQLVDRGVVEPRGAITTPSSSSVVESAGMEPGVGPPTSAWWARLAAKPSSSPSRRRA